MAKWQANKSTAKESKREHRHRHKCIRTHTNLEYGKKDNDSITNTKQHTPHVYILAKTNMPNTADSLSLSAEATASGKLPLCSRTSLFSKHSALFLVFTEVLDTAYHRVKAAVVVICKPSVHVCGKICTNCVKCTN